MKNEKWKHEPQAKPKQSGYSIISYNFFSCNFFSCHVFWFHRNLFFNMIFLFDNKGHFLNLRRLILYTVIKVAWIILKHVSYLIKGIDIGIIGNL